MAKRLCYLYIEDTNYLYNYPLVFLTRKRLLDYLKKLYPDKKRLRLKQWTHYPDMFTLLNHTTPVDAHKMRIVLAEIDTERHP